LKVNIPTWTYALGARYFEDVSRVDEDGGVYGK
jgi:hypothetical protein